jgi:hypothetical protein
MFRIQSRCTELLSWDPTPSSSTLRKWSSHEVDLWINIFTFRVSNWGTCKQLLQAANQGFQTWLSSSWCGIQGSAGIDIDEILFWERAYNEEYLVQETQRLEFDSIWFLDKYDMNPAEAVRKGKGHLKGKGKWAATLDPDDTSNPMPILWRAATIWQRW